MIFRMYSVYDSKAELYMQPFFMHTKGHAHRAWEDTVNDPKTQFNQHPSDFTLFEIGTFDDLTCKVDLYESKLPIGTALEFLRSRKGVEL